MDNNLLETLIGGPIQVDGYYGLGKNPLLNLYGLPENFNNTVFYDNTKIEELLLLFKNSGNNDVFHKFREKSNLIF